MTRRSTPGPASKPGQLPRAGARVLDSARHDPYAPKGKHKAMCCSTCGAVCLAGRWQWSAASLPMGTCPACRRVADRMPAGRITLAGPYVAEHRDELLRLARHEAETERAQHPLHRIMEVEVDPDVVAITTTDIHLPRRIGEALRRAHDGRLTTTFAQDAYDIRVDWQR